MSSIVQPPTAPASQSPPAPPPVAAAATGTPPPAPAAVVETSAPSDDITITSTTDTAEQVAAALAHKTPVPAADQTPEQQAAAAAAATATTTTSAEEDEAAAAAASDAGRTLSGRKKTYQQRLDEVVYEREENRRLAETRAQEAAAHAAESARLKAENDALRAGKPVPGAKTEAPAPPAKPTLKDFEGEPDPYQAYTDAVSQWTADRAVEKALAEVNGRLSTRDKADQDRQAATEAQASQERDFAVHKARVETFRTTLPDYDKVVSDAMTAIKDSAEGVFFIPPALAAHIQYTETGPAVFYNLVQDQKEFRRIASMPQVGPMLVALGKYEAKLEAAGKLAAAARPAPDAATRARDALTSSSQAAAPVITAPLPPPLVGNGSTASTVTPDEQDFRTFANARNAAERTRRR